MRRSSKRQRTGRGPRRIGGPRTAPAGTPPGEAPAVRNVTVSCLDRRRVDLRGCLRALRHAHERGKPSRDVLDASGAAIVALTRQRVQTNQALKRQSGMRRG